MTDTYITRSASLGPCPHCHSDLTAECAYLVGSTQNADVTPTGEKAPAVPVGMIANLTLTGLRIDHACGSEKVSTKMPGGVQPGIFGSSIEGPHSRFCGLSLHPHGPSCAVDCPTCAGARTSNSTAANG